MGVLPLIVAIEDVEIRAFLKRTLMNGFRVQECLQESRLVDALHDSDQSILFLGHPGVIDAFRVAERIRLLAPKTLITLITRQSSENTAIAALRAGISNYIRFPSEKESVIQYLNSFSHNGNGSALNNEEAASFTRLVGNSPFVRQLRIALRRAAACDNNILITGETGTGKELAAEIIHENSSRRNYPFECINCAALPDSLFESELFGYERGAFTGAVTSYQGKLSLADKGTILFDEIGDMSPVAQAKILRLVEGKPYHRLGGQKLICPNVRFISATNRDLEIMVAEERFRSDLFFRINVCQIKMLPLRDRMEDLPALLNEILRRFNRKYGRKVATIPEEVIRLFLTHPWSGNIRELLNTMDATFANIIGDEIRLRDVSSVFMNKVTTVTPPGTEQERLLRALRSTDWNLSRAAKQLSVSRMTVYRKMAKYHICRQISFTENQKELSDIQPDRLSATDRYT